MTDFRHNALYKCTYLLTVVIGAQWQKARMSLEHEHMLHNSQQCNVGMPLNQYHCRSLWILGVVIADDFSVTQHVQRLVTSSAQTNYAQPLTEQCSLAAHLPRYRCSWFDVCRQRMARFYQGVNTAIDHARLLGCCSPETVALDESAILWMTNYSAKLFVCRTTYCTHYYRHIIYCVSTIQPPTT